MYYSDDNDEVLKIDFSADRDQWQEWNRMECSLKSIAIALDLDI